MALARAVDIISTNPISPFAFRPDVFNMRVAGPARLAAGVLGLTVLVRHDSRQIRFAVTSGASGRASSDDVATALASAIERAFHHEGEVAVVEDVVVLLRSGSVPITCQGITSKNLLPFLQRVVGNLVAPGNKSLP